MIDTDNALYHAEVLKAESERTRQAGWLALCELQPEVVKITSYEGFCQWTKRVNALALKIRLRSN